MAANGTLSAVYALVAFGSLRLFATLNASSSPVWPPTGVAIAVLLLWGPRLWPGVFLGAFVANSLTAGTPVTSATIAAGNALEAIVGFWLVRRFARGVQAFDTARNVGVFAISAGLAAPIVSATIGVTSLALAGFAPWDLYGAIWKTWWLGDASGALIVAPLIVSVFRSSKPAPVGGVRELGALGLSMSAACAAVFSPVVYSTIAPIPLSFTIVPLIVWAGVRFGSRGATGATMVFSIVAVWGTRIGSGPFNSMDVNNALLSIQFSVMVLATTGLALAALVHQRLDAEEEARKAKAAERRFQTMVEYAPDAVVIADTKGRIVQVNTQTEAIFGYSRDELLRLNVEDLIPQRFRDQHRDHRAEFQASVPQLPMGAVLELFGQRKDGSEFPVEISLSPLQTDEGDLVSSSIRDISERKAREAELDASQHQIAVSEKFASLGTMVSGVGHEIRTPLTYIKTNLELIKLQIEKLTKGRTKPAEASQTIARLVSSSKDGVERADRIVQQLRQFATAQLKTEPSALHDVVTNAVELFRSVHKGEVTVNADLQPTTGFEVDKGQIQQVLINLLNNGAEAMGNTGTLTVRLRETSDGAEIEVEDNGPGIPENVQSRVFDPFFTTKTEGTGLGLSVSKRIIEAHGGTIQFTTKPSGTTFTVLLPKRHNADRSLSPEVEKRREVEP
ncbi:MAG TPA: MASE1 domain-containing protein [Candidatus Angelobacter sp.]|nr:MASE1 domain-containing protein [Candidatus Angelobacter sp.]